MFWMFRAWLVCVMAAVVLAQHRLDQEAILGQNRPRVRDRGQPELGKQDEPTCEQLKAIWRLSKRQARAPEIMNEVNSYRDPMMYNEWPAQSAVPQAAPRFRSQYNSPVRETYGRVVTKAPPNIVRSPEYEDMYGILNVPHASGKILRYPGPSRGKSGSAIYSMPPTRHKFEDVRKLIQAEHIRELQRKYDADQKYELKDLVASGRSIDDFAFGQNNEFEARGLQHLGPEYPHDDPAGRHPKKPFGGSRQVNQFSRYSDALVPPVRRSFYPPRFNNPEDYHYAPYAY